MAGAAVLKRIFQIIALVSCLLMAAVGGLGVYTGCLAFPLMNDKSGALQLIVLGFYLVIFSVILGLCEAGLKLLYKPFGFLSIPLGRGLCFFALGSSLIVLGLPLHQYAWLPVASGGIALGAAVLSFLSICLFREVPAGQAVGDSGAPIAYESPAVANRQSGDAPAFGTDV